MTRNRFIKHCLICTFILITGLGFAFTLPWFASSQGLAAKSEVGEQGSAPEATRYYVAKTGDGTNPTLGWSTAFTNVQNALSAAALTSGGEIWVAAGVYYPDQGVGQIDDAKDSTFLLADNVKLYGGFDTGDTTFSARDWESNVTVLSGDIDENDINTGGVVMTTTHIIGNNSYHVVTALGVNDTAVLDGFFITAGKATIGTKNYDKGGGFYCDGSGSGNECGPSLINVTFSGNLAQNGGAMYNIGVGSGTSNPRLRDVTFSRNSATGDGGAMYNNGENGASNPSLLNVTFSDNSAGISGGAIYNWGNFNGNSNPSLTNITFYGNSAGEHGGAMYNFGYQGNSSPNLTNVTFSGNSANLDGGAMYNYGYDGISNPSLTNVVFSGNSVVFRGGAMYNNGSESGNSSPILTNVTFSGNSAGEIGGAMYNYGYDGNSMPVLGNSILWNNQDSTGNGTLIANIYNNAATITLTHSLAQETGGSGGSWIGGSYVDGGENIDENPQFVTDVDPSTAPTTDGNLRLQTGSPAINAGNNGFVTVSTDLDGNYRIIDGIVDMGAYEFHIEVYIPLIFR